MERDSVAEKRFQVRLEAGSYFFHPRDKAKRGPKGAVCRVRLRVRCSPITQELVAKEMFHAPILGENGTGLSFEHVIEKLKHLQWPKELRDRSGIPQVRQQRRDLSLL